MKRFWALVALICLCLSFVVHFGTYLGFNAETIFPPIWILHLLAIIVPSFLIQKPAQGVTWKSILDDALPLWEQRAVKGFFLYAIVNFLIFFLTGLGSGIPQRLNGTYALYDVEDGRRIFMVLDENPSNLPTVELDSQPTLRLAEGGKSFFKELTEAEYYQQRIPDLRGFSGHWMAFFLLALLSYRYNSARLQEGSA